MAQEFFINSQKLEDQIRKLLPSQGGAGAGVDLSASSQIIPIIDLTSVAEAQVLRQDLQTAQSFNDVTTFEVVTTNTDIINNTGYWSVKGTNSFVGSARVFFTLINSAGTQKIINDFNNQQTTSANIVPFNFNVFLASGDILRVNSLTGGICRVSVKQIADIDGVLTTPS
tara:strand:- start:118 stop:627 length:510 start_codon:yes stop_codon:yes gene_type:complete